MNSFLTVTPNDKLEECTFQPKINCDNGKLIYLKIQAIKEVLTNLFLVKKNINQLLKKKKKQ